MELTASTDTYDIYEIRDEIVTAKVPVLRTALSSFMQDSNSKHLVLDLSGVSFVDSNGLSLLVNINKRLSSENRNCYLLNPSPATLETLDKVNLDKVFTIVQNTLEIDHLAVGATIEKYLPFVADEHEGLKKLRCRCPLCGGGVVSGYLVDTRSFNWRWDNEEAMYPTPVNPDTGEEVELVGAQPFICLDCFFSTTEISQFDFDRDGEVVIPSSFNQEIVLNLQKGRKERKAKMDIGIVVGDTFFDHPRGKRASRLAYTLAASCARSVAMNRDYADSYAIGTANYFTAMFSETKEQAQPLSDCRTWLVKATADRHRYSPVQISRAYFMLSSAAMICHKERDARKAFSDFTDYFGQTVPGDDTRYESPAFWYNHTQKALVHCGMI